MPALSRPQTGSFEMIMIISPCMIPSLFLIDKPAGMTSHDVVDRVRKIIGQRRVGHGGTLDPFATGLLIIGVGEGTKRLHEISGHDKTYEAMARLGATSTTFDIEGMITPLAPSIPTPDKIERVLNLFRGTFIQKAPLHSAKKIKGKKLYELARAGKATEEMRPSKQVTCSELEVTHYAWPDLSFRVTCTSGTYIRTLADDIGRELGCGAYLTTLRRTRIGPYSIADAIPLDKLDEFWYSRTTDS